MVNTTAAVVRIRTLHVKLEKVLVETQEINVVSKIETQKSELERRELIKTALRTQQQENNKEKRKLKEICKDYNDVFYVPGETLICTDAVLHYIPT